MTDKPSPKPASPKKKRPLPAWVKAMAKKRQTPAQRRALERNRAKGVVV